MTLGHYRAGGGGDSASQKIRVYNFWRDKSRAFS